MPIASGSRFGPYEVVSPLGAGGMGEVYRARDTRLQRDVAIKILPDVFAGDPDRLARFEREAQVLASLNHPRIAQIYGFEDGRALVMELVEGETLADHLARGPIPLDEALAIAQQMAEALEAAHEQRIIHRDLKPANVKVTPAGGVKVLDFGLAKLTDPVSIGSSASNGLSMSPTVMSPAMMTGAGVLLGTAAYMAPEQARGKVVDKRADIWAFGCMLYEMLAGRRIFPDTDTISDAIALVLTRDPDWQALPATTPPSIERLLRRCLQRDPDRRVHDIADARLEIEEVIAGGGVPPAARPVVSPKGTRVRHGLPWAVTLLAAGVAAWAIFMRGSVAPADAPTRRLEIRLPSAVELSTSSSRAISISPDGSRVAFIAVSGGRREAYLRRLDRFEALPVRGSEGAAMSFFSPDGQSLAIITTGGVLKTIALNESGIETVADGASFSYGGTWLADGRIVFVRAGALWQVPHVGGTPQPLTTLDAGKHETLQGWPLALPGGKALLFATAIGDQWQIETLSLDTGVRRTVVERGTLPLYGSGSLLFLRDGELLTQPFDVATATTTGPAGPASDSVPNSGATTPVVDLSATGTLVSASTNAVNRLVWVARDGTERPLNDVARNYSNPRFNPAANQLVVQAGSLWTEDLERSTFTRLPPRELMNNAFPIWTEDGTRVVYRSPTGLRVQAVDGSSEPQTITGTSEFDYATAVTRDGDTLVFLRSSQETSFDIYVAPLRGGGQPQPLVRTAAYEGGARLSPDSHWLTYVSNDSGQNEIYLRPFPGPDRRWQVSAHGGFQAIWNPNGKEIFYRDGNKMMAVSIATAPDVALSPPRMLFEQQYAFGAGITIANYDVTPDGQRFVMVKDDPSAGRLMVEMNWLTGGTRGGPPAAGRTSP